MPNAIRILFLEDVDDDVALIRSELERADTPFDLEVVSNADAFARALEAFAPHLVLSDYTLEGFDGLSALQHARAKHPDLPFIFISWLVHEDTLIEAMKKGATDYIFKHQISRLTLSVFRALREAQEREELKSAQQKVAEQERLRSLGQMASGIAHDFSNALTPVLGFSEILLNHPEMLDDKKQVLEYLQLMNTAARDAMEIVGRLRDFYRKRHKVETFLPADLRQIVEQAVLLTRPKWKNQSLARGVVVKVETEFEPMPQITGNDAALREVLMNLIFNALDAMPRGGTLSFRGRAEGEWVLLEITDTGGGMSEEVRRRCFEPFFSTKGKAGTGLGLSMVYGVIKRHDGHIEVESRHGQGTTFSIRLPAHGEPRGIGGLRSSPEKDPAAAQEPRRLDILVVEDEPVVRQVVRDFFTGDGHRVVAAAGTREALDRFRESPFDLVVTGWTLAESGTRDMMIQMKRLAPKTPIILVTGLDELARKSARPHEADFVLSKPLTLLALREAVIQVLS